ncbi:hypothetical protein EIP91_000375 [Steccherinum ochraceum]|uniref:Uncharacterized protein n=1 Tax=Steccherinum ochraceum TaxID=92696 RepID=A0A4R0RPE4_9APHY|nr:hypothetical protein EIP91_000375 [Steccherinum ochraceum]
MSDTSIRLFGIVVPRTELPESQSCTRHGAGGAKTRMKTDFFDCPELPEVASTHNFGRSSQVKTLQGQVENLSSSIMAMEDHCRRANFGFRLELYQLMVNCREQRTHPLYRGVPQELGRREARTEVGGGDSPMDDVAVDTKVVVYHTELSPFYTFDWTPHRGILVSLFPSRPVAKVPLPVELWEQIIDNIEHSTSHDDILSFLDVASISATPLLPAREKMLNLFRVKHLTIEVAKSRDQSWVSFALVRLSGLLLEHPLEKISLRGVDLRGFHPFALRACTLFKPAKLELMDVMYSQFYHISPFLTQTLTLCHLEEGYFFELIGSFSSSIYRPGRKTSHESTSRSLRIASSWDMLAKLANTIVTGPQTRVEEVILVGPTGALAHAILTNLFRSFGRSIRVIRYDNTHGYWCVSYEHHPERNEVTELHLQFETWNLGGEVVALEAHLRSTASVAATAVFLEDSPNHVPRPSAPSPFPGCEDAWKSLDALLATSAHFSTLRRYSLNWSSQAMPPRFCWDYACNDEVMRALLPRLTSKLTPVNAGCNDCYIHQYEAPPAHW